MLSYALYIYSFYFLSILNIVNYSVSKPIGFLMAENTNKAAWITANLPNEFTNIKPNPYWLSVVISWRISGPLDSVYNNDGMLIDKGVINSNKATLATASAKLKNIGLYLPNLLQFHK